MVEIPPAEVKPDTEIRKLSGRVLNGLIEILESNGDWEKLMSEIRLDCFNLDDENRKYTSNDIRVVAKAGKKNRSCTEIFFNEWGTSGRERPTVRLLYDYLKKFELWQAADYIGPTFLNLPKIDQGPNNIAPKIRSEEYNTVRIPTDRSKSVYDSQCNRSTVEHGEYIVTSTQEHEEIVSEDSISDVESIDVDTERSTINREVLSKFNDQIAENVKRIPFEELKNITQNFDESCKLGKGGSSSVYLGKLNNVDRAIKVLNSFAMEHFERELIILWGNVSHPRLLTPIAVSIDEIPSLIYPYMPHGSLEDRLALKRQELPPLGWQKRIMIASNIIEGLRYLHTRTQPMVHRDIKTSNILLDEADVAKIGDFGLIREKKKPLVSTVSTVEGTDAYLAPEAYRFQSSTKLDVYSYGMVLLELLTGLPIIDDEKGHLQNYIEEELEDENNSIINLLDEKSGNWPPEIAEELYQLANDCLNLDPKKRYDSEDVEDHVNNLINKILTR